MAKINKDRNRFERKCRAVMKYRQKAVTHRSPMNPTVSIDQIDRALDEIEAMLQNLLLTGASLVAAEPAIQFDWENVFTYPWIEPRKDDD